MFLKHQNHQGKILVGANYMFGLGKIIGEVVGDAVALPLRVLNVPFAVVNKMSGGHFDDCDNILTDAANAIDDSITEVFDDKRS